LEKAPGPKDFDTIARTYEQAVALGHWKAMQNVQILYYQGLTTHPAPALRVTELNEKLIALGAAIGYYNMANNLETGYGVKQDKKAALAYYRKSADLGSPDGQAYVGEKMVFDFKKRDLGRSMLECAIAQGSPIAARTLGLFHQLVSYNFSEMLSAMQKAVSLGDYLSALGLE
uniref:tetratricopeptide repeat protein n=1 Tax=Comamonas halotolerans TaxID=3041496 RepID=UPI0039B77745